MCVCLVIVNSPVPTVIETGSGTSCGVAAGAAEADGEEVMDTAYPATAARRETIRRVLRRRVGIADLSAPSSRKMHRHPEAVHVLTNSVYTRTRSDDKSRASSTLGLTAGVCPPSGGRALVWLPSESRHRGRGPHLSGAGAGWRVGMMAR
jgi:hypothetical protein